MNADEQAVRRAGTPWLNAELPMPESVPSPELQAGMDLLK